jgi:hypothetical protein
VAGTDVRYRLVADAECVGDHLLGLAGGAASTNLAHARSGQFGSAVRFSLLAPSPPLLLHIAYVVRLCPEEQVPRVAAPRIVAFVKNTKLAGALDCQCIGQAMCFHNLSVDSDLPVLLATLASGPLPAFIPFANARRSGCDT